MNSCRRKGRRQRRFRRDADDDYYDYNDDACRNYALEAKFDFDLVIPPFSAHPTRIEFESSGPNDYRPTLLENLPQSLRESLATIQQRHSWKCPHHTRPCRCEENYYLGDDIEEEEPKAVAWVCSITAFRSSEELARATREPPKDEINVLEGPSGSNTVPVPAKKQLVRIKVRHVRGDLC